MPRKKKREQPECGAKTREGGRCKNRAVFGGQRCRMHGGKTPRGAAHPNTKHGRYSIDLPTRLSERFGEALNDQALYDLRAEAALLQVRIGDLLKRVDTGESGHLWSMVGEAWAAYMRVLDLNRDAAEIEEKRAYVAKLIESGMTDYRAWKEILQSIDRKARLADLDRRQQYEMGLMISAPQVATLMLRMTNVFRRNVMRCVSNREERRELLLRTSNEISTLMDDESDDLHQPMPDGTA